MIPFFCRPFSLSEDGNLVCRVSLFVSGLEIFFEFFHKLGNFREDYISLGSYKAEEIILLPSLRFFFVHKGEDEGDHCLIRVIDVSVGLEVDLAVQEEGLYFLPISIEIIWFLDTVFLSVQGRVSHSVFGFFVDWCLVTGFFLGFGIGFGERFRVSPMRE